MEREEQDGEDDVVVRIPLLLLLLRSRLPIRWRRTFWAPSWPPTHLPEIIFRMYVDLSSPTHLILPTDEPASPPPPSSPYTLTTATLLGPWAHDKPT